MTETSHTKKLSGLPSWPVHSASTNEQTQTARGAGAGLEHLRQIGAEQIAALLQLGRIPLGAIAIERCYLGNSVWVRWMAFCHCR